MKTQSLHGIWNIELKRKNVALQGQIPGDVHDELVKANIVPHPHYDTNARQSYFISSEPIVYSKVFTASDNFDCARLAIYGVDGFADIYLNGKLIKRVENAFRRYFVDISEYLKKGEENELAIAFTPVDDIIGARVDELAGWKMRRVYMRKPQYNFGWDWALPLPGVGVYGFVEIQYDYKFELIDYSVKTTLDGRLDFEFEVSPSALEKGYKIQVKVTGHGESESLVIEKNRYRTYGPVKLKNPQLWWPNGYGEQPLYDYEISLIVDGKVEQTITGRVGIRQVQLLEEPFTLEAGDGYSFWILVNGKRIFIKGGNWIPTELWPGKINEDDYDFQIAMSKFANFNMLRVWGGGIYEKKRFYDLCDENGILVWQDFMFASAGYPVDKLQDEIIRECVYQIKRLRNHTSIALWCGCNEDYNSWGYTCNDADMRDLYGGNRAIQADSQSDTGVYADEGFGAIDRADADPKLFSMILRGLATKYGLGVPFVESSPMSHDDAGNIAQSGNSHISCWKYSLVKIFVTGEEFRSWREHFDEVCSFDSEFCDQVPCSTKLLKSFLKKENHWPPNEAWVYHIQRGHQNLPHYEQTLKIVGKEWGEIDTLEKYTKFGQANHLEMMRTEFESARFDYPNNGGTMMWMQNDCWPTSNWSIIDYTKNPKPCYYSAKRACATLLPIIFERKGVIYFAFSNNSFSNGTVKAVFGERNYDGEDITTNSVTLGFNEGETVRFGAIEKSKISAKTDYLYLTVEIDGKRYDAQPYFAVLWKDIKLPTPKYSVSVSEVVSKANYYEVEIEVKAQSFVRLFHANSKGNLNPVLSDNYFDMQKGEVRIIKAYYATKPTKQDLEFGDFTTDWE
ncbi:MAG: hypothetical protein IKC64_04025 [Clostridia bacterium]|nr:hypothetical protein [Clostridia bacterium]